MSDRVTEKMTIQATPEEIRAVLLDVATYPTWAKDLKTVEILSTDSAGLATLVRFRAAGMGRSTSYVLRYDHSSPAYVAWQLVEGDITRKLDGHYHLVALPDGGTEVTYELEAELKVPLPGFIKNRTQGRIMHTALAELKTRVEGSGGA